MIRIKRIYDPVSATDGYRILVDRLWPRGLKKEAASIDQWAKDIAPSTALRQWFHHDRKQWPEFRKRYILELSGNTLVADLITVIKDKDVVTLLYGAHDTEQNHAVVLEEFLKKHLKR